jgi:hypothetical protein
MAGAYGRVPRETEYKRERPLSEHENRAMPATVHNPDWDHGTDCPPARVIAQDGGWLVTNPPTGPGYDGDNTPWRR